MKSTKITKGTILLLIALMLTAISMSSCATSTDHAAEKATLSASVQWVYNSNEYKYCAKQAYVNAGYRLQTLAEGEEDGTWCVVFDMDETLVSNVQFEVELAESGEEFTQDAWNRWISRGEATVLPGAVDFCNLIHQMNGKVIVITNRNCYESATLENLINQGINYDACIMEMGAYADDSTKVQRRTDLENGALQTDDDLPPLKIIMLAGDQNHDLYNESAMTFDEAITHFGSNFIIIPNPLYGDWMSSSRKK